MNDSACFSNILPFEASTTSISIAATGGAAHATRIALWEMDSIWVKQ